MQPMEVLKSCSSAANSVHYVEVVAVGSDVAAVAAFANLPIIAGFLDQSDW